MSSPVVVIVYEHVVPDPSGDKIVVDPDTTIYGPYDPDEAGDLVDDLREQGLTAQIFPVEGWPT